MEADIRRDMRRAAAIYKGDDIPKGGDEMPGGKGEDGGEDGVGTIEKGHAGGAEGVGEGVLADDGIVGCIAIVVYNEYVCTHQSDCQRQHGHGKGDGICLHIISEGDGDDAEENYDGSFAEAMRR